MTDFSVLKEEFETILKELVLARTPKSLVGLREMVSYHFGWNDPASKTGKRLRPMLLLASSHLFGGNPQELIPAAVAMEVLHNYTLVHDDIEDEGETRHGRVCLWRQYGLAQSLNTGDFLSTMAHDIFFEVEPFVKPGDFKRAYAVFRQASLGVLRGKYMDIHFEDESNVSVDDYLEMIHLKTSCLISASIRIGAILAGADETVDAILAEIGDHAGLAFQIQDDYLGIWGDTIATGKSNLTDLITRKKTYPILLGLSCCPSFKTAWDANAQVTPELARHMAELLSNCSVDESTIEAVFYHLKQIRERQKSLPLGEETKNDYLWSLMNSAFSPTFEVSPKSAQRI